MQEDYSKDEKYYILGIVDPDDGGDMFLRNVG
jgi:hypothetical protein